jgi:hypothetical protein
VDIGGSRYLIAFVPPNGQSFELWLYDHGSRQTTQVPVSAGVGNDLLHSSPAMAYLPADPAAGRNWGRVALAWVRYQNLVRSVWENCHLREPSQHKAPDGQ